MLPVRLVADLEAQARRAAAAAPALAIDLRRVAEAVEDLFVQFDLGGYGGLMASDAKPRFLLRFATSCALDIDGDVVLKVYADQNRGEGEWLRAWGEEGVPVPVLRTGEVRGCTWLLMEMLAPLRTLTSSALVGLTGTLSALVARMHACDQGDFRRLRSLEAVMLPRWHASFAALRVAGWRMPERWAEVAASAYSAQPSVPLHGDLTLANLGSKLASPVVLFDASALAGTAAFDGARWSARLAVRGVSPRAALDRWNDGETLDPAAAGVMLGVESVLEAGSLLGDRRDRTDPVVAGLLDIAHAELTRADSGR